MVPPWFAPFLHGAEPAKRIAQANITNPAVVSKPIPPVPRRGQKNRDFALTRPSLGGRIGVRKFVAGLFVSKAGVSEGRKHINLWLLGLARWRLRRAEALEWGLSGRL